MTPRIPVKTAAGHEEIRHRQRVLSPRHRTVLFLVDGHRTEAEIRALARAAGAPDESLRDLADLGLVLIPEPAAALGPAEAPSLLPEDEVTGAALTPSRTLLPDSTASGWEPSPAALDDSFLRYDSVGDAADAAVERARDTLLRAVRAEAPIAGSITALRLRRARTRAELLALLGEVQTHVRKPHRTLACDQMLQQVRSLLLGSEPRRDA